MDVSYFSNLISQLKEENFLSPDGLRMLMSAPDVSSDVPSSPELSLFSAPDASGNAYSHRELSDFSELTAMLGEAADCQRRKFYGEAVFVRGLIEFTNYCKNNCYYCGIRCENSDVKRYRLSPDEILECCREGYTLGFRTFVLQGGEDYNYSDRDICDIVSSIKSHHPDCAITLSMGERSKESYRAYFDAGADRYLLRHETADITHYAKLHPDSMSLVNRKRCLYALKEIGYEVGAGFMVGSPFQTYDTLLDDLNFLKDLKPHMIGIGPFIRHKNTPFRNYPCGSAELTLRLISILRLMFPYANIPSTTALGTLLPYGRELGLKAGANVLMPNLSPSAARNKYELYDNKICSGDEAAAQLDALRKRVNAAGYNIICSRGDSIGTASGTASGTFLLS